ncbi:hypothetical protein HOLleu_09119 [Holothuria leucospilota]|uniref:Helix-turn-helix domain-containing protein n=1 Tax=Holothuria leucospilota TaxID=206669 RepID=A0A9Q1CJR3_HOLLE|nr:hypothetical protein HOLleu_09119 [Holothuria leucospilota]
MRSFSSSNADLVRKDLVKVFQSCGLKITVQTNLRSVNFLDVTLNLDTASYQPYRKPNDEPIYINRLSNHPPTIIKNIPQAIGRRISELSSSEEAFKNTAPAYNEALKSVGYNQEIEYQDTSATREGKKNRSRKIIWYNPPFSKNVKTNIGANFLKLISKHFPKGNKLHKIFNKSTVKVSYSCMRNMQQIIKSHNSDVLKRAHQEPQQKTCNCRQPSSCPLRGNCLDSDVIYKATVTSDNTNVSYIGLASGQFKSRYNNHTKSLRHSRYRQKTTRGSPNISGG